MQPPCCAAASRKHNCLYWVQSGLRCPDDIPGWRHARKEARILREWSSPMYAFPASGQPPTVIFCVQGITRDADRTPQQRLGMKRRPQAHCQATLAPADRVRVNGANGMPNRPDPRLNHLFFRLRVNGENCWRIQGHTATMAGEPSSGCQVRPGICGQGERKADASRQPGSSNPGSQGSGAPKKRNYRPRRITGVAAERFATPG